MKAKRKQAKSMTTSHSKEQYASIFNSTSSVSSSNYSFQDITIADHTTNTTLKVDGTIEVKGRDILKELDEMRDALLLLKRDVDMEAKYPKLKELKDAYEEQLEKYKTFEALK
jgi:hypothetical protein